MRRRTPPLPITVRAAKPCEVSFEPGRGTKQTFAILGQVVDSVNDAEDEEEGSKWISGCRLRISD